MAEDIGTFRMNLFKGVRRNVTRNTEFLIGFVVKNLKF